MSSRVKMSLVITPEPIALAHRLAQRIDERGLSRSDRTADADAERFAGHGVHVVSSWVHGDRLTQRTLRTPRIPKVLQENRSSGEG